MCNTCKIYVESQMLKVRTVLLFNKLPVYLKVIDKYGLFRAKLKDYLLQNCIR